MSEKGQIVVPKDIRDRHSFGNGSTFSVRQTKSGSLVFHPVQRQPKKDLVDALMEFKGLEIPEKKFRCPPRL
jgi:bifunctional DNA-binding transcriptional regulator/antitoxin component of YhaV-PrlF toxin-antitoxin module